MNKPTKKELYQTIEQLEGQIKEQRKMYKRILEVFNIEMKTDIVEPTDIQKAMHKEFRDAHCIKWLYSLGESYYYSYMYVKDKYLHLWKD
jgi:uncharacterized protein Yka (UPF0111/DUF47 family)